MQKAEELIRLKDEPLPLSKERLIESLIPRIGFTSYPRLSRALPLGASRFGGPADLPAGIEWPRLNGRPLLLLAQLHFGELKVARQHPLVKPLPEHGWLCLFWDLGEYAHGVPGRGIAGHVPGVVAMQFEGEAGALIRHEPEPATDAETWTHCHAVTAFPGDNELCLPYKDAVDSPLPEGESEESREAYEALMFEIDDLARKRHDVTLLGSPTLFNPDPRHSLPNPHEWMLLLEFNGECGFLAIATAPMDPHLSAPSFAGADFVQYFVRRSDYEAGRLDRGFLDRMLS